MLRAGRMEEFVTEEDEEEPWYDQRDLEQGEAHKKHLCFHIICAFSTVSVQSLLHPGSPASSVH